MEELKKEIEKLSNELKTKRKTLKATEEKEKLKRKMAHYHAKNKTIINKTIDFKNICIILKEWCKEDKSFIDFLEKYDLSKVLSIGIVDKDIYHLRLNDLCSEREDRLQNGLISLVEYINGNRNYLIFTLDKWNNIDSVNIYFEINGQFFDKKEALDYINSFE